MLRGFMRRVSSLGIWGGLCSVFSLFIAAGSPALSILILAALIFYLLILAGPQIIAAFWLMGSPTVFGFPNMVLRPLPFVTMERVLLITLALMVFMRMTFVREKFPRWTREETFILIFLIYAAISLVLHTSPETYSKDGWFLFQYALPMTAYIVSRRIEWSEAAIKRLMACLCGVGVILSLIGIMQALFGITIFTMDYQNITAGHVGRAYGPFSNAHTFIATLFIFLTLTLMLYSMYRDPMIRFVLIVLMGLMVVSIVLGQTRTPWGGVALALLIIFLRDRSVRPLLVFGGAVAVVVGIAVLFWKMDQLGSFIDRVTSLNTLAGRVTVWATAMNMIVHNPLFGVGFTFDAFTQHKPEYITGIGMLSAQYAVYLSVPHNEYIHVTVLLGLTGLVLFGLILYGVVKRMFQAHTFKTASPLTQKLGLYVGAIFIGLMFNSLFSDTYIQDYFWTVSYFLAGLVSGLVFKAEKASVSNLEEYSK